MTIFGTTMNSYPTSCTGSAAWSELWRNLGLTGDPASWHARLVAAYTEPDRHYHSRQHIDEYLQELAAVQTLARQPAHLAAALWFHDVVYDSRSNRNEEDSALLATDCLRAAGASGDTIEAVAELIMGTKTHEPGRHPDAALIIDIDLAILAQPPARFDEYERGSGPNTHGSPRTCFVRNAPRSLPVSSPGPRCTAPAIFRKNTIPPPGPTSPAPSPPFAPPAADRRRLLLPS